MIVSVSRRCDIPRFQFDWFMERLNTGFVEVVNPFNAHQVRRVSLLPGGPGLPPEDGVTVFVFWTRDPRAILANADELTERGFPFYVMTTVTAYPALLEPNMTRTEEVLTAMKKLAQKIGPDRVIWRYDPVLFSTITGESFHRKNFDALARELAGSVHRVIISMYDEYRKPQRRFDRLERAGALRLMDASVNPGDLLADLARIAGAAGMEIQNCAQKEDFSSFGIMPGACINAALIEKLWGLELRDKDKNQRPNCLCCKSVDIGRYGSCAARCIYCYAW